MKGKTVSTIQTDATLKSWAQSADALGAQGSHEVMAAVESAARLMRASDDIVADALPHAFIAVSRDGIAPMAAAVQIIRNLMRREATRAQGEPVASLDALADWQRDALEVARESGRDTVARSYGGGERENRRSLADALDMAPESAARLMRAVLADGLAPRVNALTGKVSAPRYTVRMIELMTSAPLRVGVMADALGIDRPHHKGASDAIRMTVCRAWATVECWVMHPDDDWPQGWEPSAHDVAALADAAYAYVTRDRTADYGQAVWQYDARPTSLTLKGGRKFALSYDSYRPERAILPDMADMAALSGDVRPFQRVTGHKANTGSKGRKGAAAGQVAMGVPHGVAGNYCPTLRDTSATVSAARKNATLEGAELAERASEARAHGAICKRFDATLGALPLAPRHGTMADALTCKCGQSVALVITLIITGHGAEYVVTHALPLCASPVEGVCRCSARTGILTDDGRHKRRAGKGARSML